MTTTSNKQTKTTKTQSMFSVQSFLHRLSVVLGSGPDRTTSHFLIKTTPISFLAYYTECSLTNFFCTLVAYIIIFFISILHFINIYCSRVAVCRPIVLSIKRIYHHKTSCTRLVIHLLMGCTPFWMGRDML